MSENIFWQLGCSYINHDLSRSHIVGLRRYMAAFGVSPNICKIIWSKLEKPVGAKPCHLLWALLFLKTYSSEHLMRSIIKVDEKTARKWIWLIIEKIASLNMVIWESRFENAAPNAICFVSLDGTDFKINEPSPFHKKWFSHKFKSAGLRYEIGLCIQTGKIVWANGPYPCGDWPDLKIARDDYVKNVGENEVTLGDKGYRDMVYFVTPTLENADRHKRIMSRHETVNERIKQFKVMDEKFRHDIKKHSRCFYAVVNLTEIMIENGFALYSC